MAEVVEARIEKGINELLEIERAGLFTAEEVRTVVKKRREMEYRLQRKMRSKFDYLKYISYEEALLQLIKIRRQKIGFRHKFKVIERNIMKKIASLYNKAVTKFQSDVQLWLNYIEFCRKQKWKGSVSDLFGRMLRIHNKKDDLWALAARWELQSNNSVDSARNLMQQALRFNPRSKTLFREYFAMELQYAEKIRKRKEMLSNSRDEQDEDDAANDTILSGEVAAVIYESAVSKLSDPDFAIELYHIVAEYGESFRQLSEKLLKDLETRFPNDEKVMQLLQENRMA